MKAVAFDYGNTLASSGLPLNWQNFYREALTAVLTVTNSDINPNKLQDGEKILLKYNTRVNEREYEVISDTIFNDLFQAWSIADLSMLKVAKDAFYQFFFARMKPYAETESVLKELKSKNVRIGVLTDTAYGADKEYLTDRIPVLMPYFDAFLSSTDVGFRKPNAKGYLQLVKELKVKGADCLFVGDESKDVIGANRVEMVSVLINRNKDLREYGQKYTVNSLRDILSLI
jgi:putative hydrolase of the HAD superfamily